jgi:AcrR family transcriptional regulator
MGVTERRQREKVERREAILNAAERVLSRRGLSTATMEEVAHEAELSKGALYLYFSGKDELFVGVARRALDDLERKLGEISRDGGDSTGLDLVAALLETYAAVAAEQGQRFRAAMSWLGSDHSVPDATPGFAEYREGVLRLVDLAVQAISRGQEDGSIRSDLKALELAVQLWAAALGVLTVRSNAGEVRRRLPPAVNVEHLLQGFVALMVRGLGVGSDQAIGSSVGTNRSPRNEAS